MIKMCCDICGKEINDEKDTYTTVSVSDCFPEPDEIPFQVLNVKANNYHRYDMCEECGKKVKKTFAFMTN